MAWALSILAAAAIAASAPAAAPPAFTLPKVMAGRTILYVGAHPDDEWGVAPILAEACLDRGARCHFLVVADGRSVGCVLTIGLRDVEECSRRRRAEMKAAAALFGGEAEFLGLEDLFYAHDEDGKTRVLARWAEASGGRAALVARIAAIIRRERPMLILTFDPRHGSSCHPGHRAAAALVAEAVRTLPPKARPPVWLEQTVDAEERLPEAKAVIDGGGYAGWPDTEAETRWYDANRRLKNGRTGYDYAIADRKAHATQAPDEASGETVLNPPIAARRVPLARLGAASAGDFCSALKLKRPTFDIAANRQRFGME